MNRFWGIVIESNQCLRRMMKYAQSSADVEKLVSRMSWCSRYCDRGCIRERQKACLREGKCFCEKNCSAECFWMKNTMVPFPRRMRRSTDQMGLSSPLTIWASTYRF